MERVATVNNGGIPGVYDINLFVIKDTWSVLQYLAIFDRYTDCHYTLEFADSNDELLETVLEICKFRGILNKRLESLQEPLDDYDRVVVSSNIVNVLDNLNVVYNEVCILQNDSSIYSEPVLKSGSILYTYCPELVQHSNKYKKIERFKMCVREACDILGKDNFEKLVFEKMKDYEQDMLW